MTLSLTDSLTKVRTLLIDIQRATLETCDLWDIWSKWWGDMTWPKDLPTHLPVHLPSICDSRDLFSTCSPLSQPFLNFFSIFLNFFSQLFFWTFSQLFSTCDLWHLRHWLKYWQLRTWNHDNLCYLTINCDTGQHSQFLRCLLFTFSTVCLF